MDTREPVSIPTKNTIMNLPRETELLNRIVKKGILLSTMLSAYHADNGPDNTDNKGTKDHLEPGIQEDVKPSEAE